MTHNVARSSQFRRTPSRRVGAVVGALIAAFGLFAGFPTPAAAECTQAGVPFGGGTGGLDRYTCRRFCVVLGAEAPRLRSLTLRGGPSWNCMNWCDATPGCVAVSGIGHYEMIDGRAVLVTYCTLYGAGAMTTANEPRRPSPGEMFYVCVRDNPPRTPYPPQIDLDRFRPDQYRPGVPGPGLPKK